MILFMILNTAEIKFPHLFLYFSNLNLNFSPLLEQRQKGLNLQGVILVLSTITLVWVLRVDGRPTISTITQMANTWLASTIPGGRIPTPGTSNLTI